MHLNFHPVLYLEDTAHVRKQRSLATNGPSYTTDMEAERDTAPITHNPRCVKASNTQSMYTSPVKPISRCCVLTIREAPGKRVGYFEV